MTREFKSLFGKWFRDFKNSDFEEAVLFFKEKNIDIIFEKNKEYYMWKLPQHEYSIYALGLSKVELTAKKAAIDAAIYFFQKTIPN